MSWPRDYHPIHDGEPDTAVTVPLFAHEPGNTDQLVAWCGGSAVVVNGAPVVVLPGHRHVADRLVGLGDLAANPVVGDPRAVLGAELATTYLAADADQAPPAD